MARRRKSPLVPGARAALDALSVRVRQAAPGEDGWEPAAAAAEADPDAMFADGKSIWVERFRARMRAAVMREYKNLGDDET